MKIKHVLVIAAAAGLTGIASADTVTAQYSGRFNQNINVTQVGVHNGDILTVTFDWTRLDSAGPGVDATLPMNFPGYCIEIGQTVAGGTPYVYEVQTAAMHGFTALQEVLLGRLWNSYQGAVIDPATSGAFQMAVWELAFDAGADLSSGNFTGNGGAGIVATSQSWLNAINAPGYSGGQAPISVLHHESAQDQLVPAPGSIALLGMGGVLLTKRRRLPNGK